MEGVKTGAGTAAYRQADLATLRQTALFAGLTEAQLRPLLERPGVSVASFRRGETIYAPAQFSRSLGVLLSGSATVEKRGGANKMLMSVLRAGDLFGAASLFAPAATRRMWSASARRRPCARC